MGKKKPGRNVNAAYRQCAERGWSCDSRPPQLALPLAAVVLSAVIGPPARFFQESQSVQARAE